MVTDKLSFDKRIGGEYLKTDGKGTSINRMGHGNKAMKELWEGRRVYETGEAQEKVE